MNSMKSIKLVNLLLGTGFLLGACSIRISDVIPTPRDVVADAPQQSIEPVAQPTTIPLGSSTMTETAPLATVTTGEATPELPTTLKGLLPELPDLGLEGRLVFLSFTERRQVLLALDLATGSPNIIFQSPLNTWMTGASVSPDGEQVVIAYAPPPSEDEPQYGYTGLYVLPIDGSSVPQSLLLAVQSQEAFFNPSWSPDGQQIFFAKYISDDTLEYGFKYFIGRMVYPDGGPEIIVEDAFWHRPSPDGNRLAYATFVPSVYEKELLVVNVDGSNPTLILPTDAFPTVDAPFFSPDDEMLYFSAESQDVPQPTSWLERLFRVQVALAHDASSDWWRVPVSGGAPERITQIYGTGLFGDFSPDGQFIAFISSGGLHIMQPDGNGLITLIGGGDYFGTLDWAP